ncbi:MAG: hypothetical protein E2586_22970 [Novosphingobium sp.]|nr:hypothetical protein [Novosphingobium sp.]
MPVFRDIMLRLSRPFFLYRSVTLRFRTDARTARFVAPLIERLISDDRDGETYRCAIAHWHHAERPALERYLGSVSLCRIDGPLQEAPADYPDGWLVPLGGLIETPGATAHLTPFEAASIQHRIQEAIEREIVDWSREHRLYDLPPVPAHHNRPSADRAAMALIVNWTADSDPPRAPLRTVEGGTNHG